MTNNNWSWYDADGKSSTVVPSVSAIAVYTNQQGDIVIRQQGEAGTEDDSVVVIPRTQTNAVIKAMRAELALKHEPLPPL